MSSTAPLSHLITSGSLYVFSSSLLMKGNIFLKVFTAYNLVEFYCYLETSASSIRNNDQNGC